ncbi:MAG: hypothetical protein MJZ23_07345 [Paludibacteraceae bacterium]|nr:hypothetical protein [Paludibacteraceae bacterium]
MTQLDLLKFLPLDTEQSINKLIADFLRQKERDSYFSLDIENQIIAKISNSLLVSYFKDNYEPFLEKDKRDGKERLLFLCQKGQKDKPKSTTARSESSKIVYTVRLENEGLIAKWEREAKRERKAKKGKKAKKNKVQVLVYTPPATPQKEISKEEIKANVSNNKKEKSIAANKSGKMYIDNQIMNLNNSSDVRMFFAKFPDCWNNELLHYLLELSCTLDLKESVRSAIQHNLKLEKEKQISHLKASLQNNEEKNKKEKTNWVHIIYNSMRK